ncbi:hypothetical protein [Brevibacillus massiliensis]|uniref:hypothetical protein n=1 Tax=Brevibacillus massiliensis TaxID=1118054 RepID=UPI0002DB4D86|nr:hypothetical protein [Brevibacillus massiliensis]
MEDILTILQSSYGLQIQNYDEIGGQTLLETDHGLYYFYSYPVGYRSKRRFVERVKKHLETTSGFIILPFVETQGKQPYVENEDELFFLHPGVREAVLEDPAFLTGQALAEFHQATISFPKDRLSSSYVSLGAWPNMWKKRLGSYDQYRDEVEGNRGFIQPFDEYLLTSYSYVSALGDTAIRYLTGSGYQQVVKQTPALGRIAYQNFDKGYILFDEAGQRYLAGPYSWVVDMRSRDIGQWIKARIWDDGWNPADTLRFLDGYNSVAPLLPEEYPMIYALLLFPGRFLRMVDLYHGMPLEEREKLSPDAWEAGAEEELMVMEGALREFPLLLRESYGIEIPVVEWFERESVGQA